MTWLTTLQQFYDNKLVHRCPDDRSTFWDEPIPGSNPPMYRGTSFGINNYVDPGHAPSWIGPYKKITQVKRASSVVHFIEVVETGTYATSDHIHVENFASSVNPSLTPQRGQPARARPARGAGQSVGRKGELRVSRRACRDAGVPAGLQGRHEEQL